MQSTEFIQQIFCQPILSYMAKDCKKSVVMHPVNMLNLLLFALNLALTDLGSSRQSNARKTPDLNFIHFTAFLIPKLESLYVKAVFCARAVCMQVFRKLVHQLAHEHFPVQNVATYEKDT